MDPLKVSLRTADRWEALDLGIKLVQVWKGPLYLILFLLSAPLVAAAAFTLPFWLTMIIIWWFKPLFESIMLQIMAVNAFGQYHGFSFGYLKKALGKSRLISLLTWRRLAPDRSFTMPIIALDGLRGQALNTRIRLFKKEGHLTASFWNTLVFWMIEIIIFTIPFFFFFLFLSQVLLPDELRYVEFYNSFKVIYEEYSSPLIVVLFFYLAVWVMIPFQCAAGFSLYLSRRARLESWDIELVFRKLARRFQKKIQSSGSALIIVFVFVILSVPLSARVLSRTELNAQLETILSNEDFGAYQEISLATNKGSDWNLPQIGDLSGIGQVLEFILWAVVVSLAVYLLYRIYRWRRELTRENKELPADSPGIICGLPVTKESLPSDIIRTVSAFWQEGKYLEAVSLLYRAALSQLIQDQKLSFKPAHTERQCQKLAARVLSPEHSRFFNQITGIWLRSAYARHLPDQEEFTAVLNQWGSFFK